MDSSVKTDEPDGDDKGLLVILATNDIHGGIDPTFNEGSAVGGLSNWQRIVTATRGGVKAKYGAKSDVLLLDAGDQFQGTLLSNWDEGATMFDLMSQIGYDAAVPGNHAYDFGPIDRPDFQDFRDVDPDEEERNDDEVERFAVSNPLNDPELSFEPSPGREQRLRGALRRAMSRSQFPLISANIYTKHSIVNTSGAKIRVSSVKCAPESLVPQEIAWEHAKRPEGFRPFHVAQFAEVPAIVIGLDNDTTPTTTIDVNVRDLCFRDQADAYLAAVTEARADLAANRPEFAGVKPLFILAIHDSDLPAASTLSQTIERILDRDGDALHAVVAGHTHRVETRKVRDVPIIQSGNGGSLFGRMDLVWDKATGRVDWSKGRTVSGVKIIANGCDPKAESFCSETPEGIKYDGNLLSPASSALTAVIEAARNRLPPHLNQIVGSASDLVKRDFNKDSPMARFVTDQMREATGADFAFINTGSLRANFEKGAVAYDALYKMLPFATRLVVLNDVPTRTIIDTLKISAAGSKPYGFLVQSGLKIKLGSSANQRFLQSVTTLAGEPLYQKQPDGEHYLSDRVFRVATTDFLMRRNSGPEVLRSFRPKVDLGVLREVIARKLLDSPAVIPTTVDDRWQ